MKAIHNENITNPFMRATVVNKAKIQNESNSQPNGKHTVLVANCC